MAIDYHFLRFDSEAAANALFTLICEAADELTNTLESQIASAMGTQEGRNDLSHTVDRDTLSRSVHCEVIGRAYAVLDSYGKGSLMDMKNPFLDAYRHSAYWNPSRKDTHIRTRPEGEYTDIFGETKRGGPGTGGFDLESTGDPRFEPKAPSFAFQNTEKMFFNSDVIDRRIQRAYREFMSSIGKFFTNG